MNYINHLNNYEIFKIANELATEFYPSASDKKDERDMLIDFKDVLRKALKSKARIISHEQAGVLLQFMNPKRKWPWSELETLNVIFEIEPNFEVFQNLMEAGGFSFEKTNENLIFKYLILGEIYDRSVLRFLYKVYDLVLPELKEPFVEENKDSYTEEDLKSAKKSLKSGNFKPASSPILAKTKYKIKGVNDIDDIENSNLLDNLDDLDDIDVLDIDVEDMDNMDDMDDDFDDLKIPSKTVVKTKPIIQKSVSTTSTTKSEAKVKSDLTDKSQKPKTSVAGSKKKEVENKVKKTSTKSSSEKPAKKVTTKKAAAKKVDTKTTAKKSTDTSKAKTATKKSAKKNK